MKKRYWIIVISVLLGYFIGKFLDNAFLAFHPDPSPALLALASLIPMIICLFMIIIILKESK